MNVYSCMCRVMSLGMNQHQSKFDIWSQYNFDVSILSRNEAEYSVPELPSTKINWMRFSEVVLKYKYIIIIPINPDLNDQLWNRKQKVYQTRTLSPKCVNCCDRRLPVPSLLKTTGYFAHIRSNESANT